MKETKNQLLLLFIVIGSISSSQFNLTNCNDPKNCKNLHPDSGPNFKSETLQSKTTPPEKEKKDSHSIDKNISQIGKYTVYFPIDQNR